MSVTEVTDTEAISRLLESFDLQKRAALADPYPTLDERREHLAGLAGAVMAHRDRIREAMRSDFATHPDLFTDLVEVLGIAGRATYALERLAEWADPQERWSNPEFYGSGQALVRHQPKGVVGNIVPWNFPFDLSLGPLVEMLAAGNRVIIKPSEHTPACAEVLAALVRETFDRDKVDVAIGGLELAKAFPTLRWDHLLYTGSPQIGREIAKAAAENLVPVTLELGGKCPVIVAEDSMDAETVEQVVGVKLIKNGQMCITADHCLVARDQLPRFVELAREHMQAGLADYSSGSDCTGIISERHLERLLELVEEARARGVEVVQLDQEGGVDHGQRRMPLYLIVDPPEDLGIMREEIFGPILPVVPYDSLDEAIERVNSGERPLALYVFAKDEAVAERVLQQTVSGGACVNTCATHGGLPSLPFGGIGQSGTGRHHGVEGFREFSNTRGVFVRGEGDALALFLPPYTAEKQATIDGAFAGPS